MAYKNANEILVALSTGKITPEMASAELESLNRAAGFRDCENPETQGWNLVGIVGGRQRPTRLYCSPHAIQLLADTGHPEALELVKTPEFAKRLAKFEADSKAKNKASS